MNRRDLMRTAPVALLVGAAPAVASTETPIMSMFRKWEELREEERAIYAVSETGGEDKAVAATSRCHEQERLIMRTPCQTAQDFVAKVAVNTAYGDFQLLDGRNDPDFWAEARALIAGAV